jgi:hypothetical protein
VAGDCGCALGVLGWCVGGGGEVKPVLHGRIVVGDTDYEITPHGRTLRIYRRRKGGWLKVRSRREIRDVLIAANLLETYTDEGIRRERRA